jgi:predicted dehydrogenase
VTTLHIGVIGFGWMGQAHARSYLRIPTLFPDERVTPALTVVADTVAARRDLALDSFGFAHATADWREVVEHPGLDVIDITAPNAMHLPLVRAAAAAGRAVFCEKPVGQVPADTVAAEKATRQAGVLTGVGYNYRWAPLVQHTRGLIAAGRLGRLTHYRGRFFSMYGQDPLGTLSWRYQQEAGYGVLMDIMSHAIDMAHFLVGPIARVTATRDIFVPQRPLPSSAAGSHYARGRPVDPMGAVTNEDYVAALVEFAGGTRGVLEADRTMVGPESQMAFELNGRAGAARWNLEDMNTLDLYLVDDDQAHLGYRRILGGDRFPDHGAFVPGAGNPIGWEDLKAIEALHFLRSVADGVQGAPGMDEARAVAHVQQAMIRSWESNAWEGVATTASD